MLLRTPARPQLHARLAKRQMRSDLSGETPKGPGSLKPVTNLIAPEVVARSVGTSTTMKLLPQDGTRTQAVNSITEASDSLVLNRRALTDLVERLARTEMERDNYKDQAHRIRMLDNESHSVNPVRKLATLTTPMQMELQAEMNPSTIMKLW
ncbi:hypothetical protein M427DRAFT_27592 [Gonapodya prolifera JEL478]|uniref:Uncharacterized protein n=1 Tax=Gonapodya prolifera (strain JEL478) TaxID=1344416 RepID=A0A139AWR8_GONPJ|nr:hypothetical protein M427DRAFT_27592 [Gonapodya prolifera JEL478]|eukprot:KXS21149.1 hypothetical protein M427DRAFT_27592 [Gonapodya prolifera JEL478]